MTKRILSRLNAGAARGAGASPLQPAFRQKIPLLVLGGLAFVRLVATAQAQTTVTLDELSVESARGMGVPGRSSATNGLPPPTGTVGQPTSAYPGGQVGSGARLGVFGNRGVFDAPFNVTGYTDTLIRDQQAKSLLDVVANDPSVRSVGSLSDAYGSSVLIRGFLLQPGDFGFDGLFGIVDFRRPFVFNAERIEVLKGPSALINGAVPNGGVGGSINIIPKRAFDEPLTRITPFFVSQGQLGTQVDVGRRFGDRNEWGVRANGVYQNGQTAIDKERLEFGFGSLGVDYRGERFRASFDFAYQDTFYDRNRGFFFVFPGVAIPPAPQLSRNLDQSGQYQANRSFLGATRLEYDLTDRTTVYAAFGAGTIHENDLSNFKFLLSPTGTISNTFVRQDFDNGAYTAEAGLRTRFDTGPIRHGIALATTGYWTDLTYPLAVQFLPNSALSNIYAPVPVAIPSFTDKNIGDARGTSQINRSIAFADTLSSFDDRVSLTFGVRAQQLSGKGFDFTPGSPTFRQATSHYDSTAVSPAVALLVKPTDRLSIYGNYVEALIAPPTAPITAPNAGQAFPPIVADQKEVGLKYDFGSFGTSLAVFEISRANASQDPATLRFAVNGLQRNRGIEFNVFGEPVPGLRLLGGIAAIDGRLVRTAGRTFDGKAAPGVPDLTINLYGEYDLPAWLLPGMTATGRVIHTARQFYDQDNRQIIPDWTRIDAGLRYTFVGSWGKPVTLRADVVNVFNTNYYASSGFSGILSLGTPRTYLLSAQLDF